MGTTVAAPAGGGGRVIALVGDLTDLRCSSWRAI